MRPRFGLLAVLGLLLTACAPGGPPTTRADGSSPQQAVQPQRTLAIITRNEPSILTRKFPATGSNAQAPEVAGLFHASFFRFDERKNPLPWLVESVPQLNTDTWRVFPDGRMEVTYLLRPGLTWHDGAPLTADDYVFAWRVYAVREHGFRPQPQNLMEEVSARDPRTVVIRWSKAFPWADALSESEFPAVPRHILEDALSQGNPEAFINHPYWSTQWIGLGPYRLARWEPGAFIEGVAFDGHALGRPKIERVRAIFMNDANTAAANLLADAAHITLDASITFQQGVLLKREWSPRNAGTVTMTATEVRFMHVQHRPDVVSPDVLRDVRVRKALAYAIDKQALNDGLLDGEGKPADTLLPVELYTPAVDQAITKYRYDPRRMEQLLIEAGLTRGSSGSFVGAGGARFAPEVRTIGGKQEEQELAILLNGYRQAGIDAPGYVLPAAQSSSGQALASFPALFTGKSNLNDMDGGLDKLLSSKVPRPENRWTGSALGGYTSPEFDRLYEHFESALRRADREEAIAGMSKMISEEVSAIPMYYNFEVSAHVTALKGPREGLGPDGYVQEWEWR